MISFPWFSLFSFYFADTVWVGYTAGIVRRLRWVLQHEDALPWNPFHSKYIFSFWQIKFIVYIVLSTWGNFPVEFIFQILKSYFRLKSEFPVYMRWSVQQPVSHWMECHARHGFERRKSSVRLRVCMWLHWEWERDSLFQFHAAYFGEEREEWKDVK